MCARVGFLKDPDIRNKIGKIMKNTHRLIFTIIITLSFITISHAEEKKVVKGFSGGMMVHTGYQFGGDNPFNLNISSPTFGIGGCAKIHLTRHFRIFPIRIHQ